MSAQATALKENTSKISALKEQFEQLFPGKWLIDKQRARNIRTGIAEIDAGITRGIARTRITELSGPLSSGKTTILRSAVKFWCSQGLNVAYIDSGGRLYAADWTFVENQSHQIDQNNQSGQPGQSVQMDLLNGGRGIFWIVRPATTTIRIEEAVWSADQFIRSNVFDVVILDTGGIPNRRRMYTRLQNLLDRSRAALLVVYDTASGEEETASARPESWGCHTFNFAQSTFNYIKGLSGFATVVPQIKFAAWRAGQSQNMEVNLAAAVPNRLFTHPRVPDRRTPKGRTSPPG